MSEQAACAWLNDHNGLIPSYDDYHLKIVEMLEEAVASMAEIADVIMLDPGLSIALLRKVNSKLKNSRRPIIETVHTAMGHLGKPAITSLVNKHPTLGDSCADAAIINRYRQLLSQNHHALAQLDGFAQIQGINTVDDMRTAILLHNLGEFYTCLFDAEKYQAYRQASAQKPDKKALAVEAFGFDFDHLGKFLTQHWYLPELLEESFEASRKTGRKAQLVQLANAISYEAESGWYHQAMQQTQKECSEFLNLSTDETWFQIQTTAIQAAQNDTLGDVMPAASRLILQPDLARSTTAKTVKPAIKEKPGQASFEARLRLLLQSRDTNQTQLLNLLLDNLYQDIGYSKVALMLISDDKPILTTRTGRGLDRESPFQKLKLEVATSGMIQLLLQKPQAVCINATNYRKYENNLPGKFKATCLCNNFVLMSLFIGDKPVGLIYCDRSISGEAIDRMSYARFKADVMMTSKALTYLAKRKTRAAA